MLLRGCPELETSEERRVHEQLKALLEGQQNNKPRARPRASAPSAGGQEHHLRTVQICLLLSIESAGREAGPRHQRSRAILGPTEMRGASSRPDARLRALTTTAMAARATTMIVGADGATTATTTATAAGPQTKEVHGPLAGAFAT
jgi:hypothetical protein